MFDFFRVAACVPSIAVGDVDYNTDEIINMVRKNTDADVIVFPELALTGYTCADLFYQNEMLNSVLENLVKLLSKTKRINSIIAVGAPLRIQGKLYNCAVIMQKGNVLGVCVKSNLPNYNEFSEKRWFSSAVELKTDCISSLYLGLSLDYTIPIGKDLIFNMGGCVKFGVEICEDLCSPLPVSTMLSLNGAQVILNLSASNEVVSKREYRTNLVKHQSAVAHCAYILASSGESESTTDVVFSGHSLICENGTVLKQNNKLVDGNYFIKTDIDLGKIKADRLKDSSFKDGSSQYLCPCREIFIDTKPECDASLYSVSKLPFVPDEKSERIKRCMDIFNLQVAGLKKRVLKTGGKMVLGVSGGLDSTLTLLVCVETAKQLNMPLTDVIAITLPCFGTTKRTHSNAWDLMQSLGVRSLEIDIKDACTKHCNDIGHPVDCFDVTYENIQARERTQVLMDFACKEGGFVVGTGDLSELALGWCTYNADHMSMYGVNSGVPKTLIRWMISALIEYDVFPDSAEVLKDIIDTPISPELLPPDEKGDIVQETEEIIGPYALHDFFLYYTIRYGYSPSKIFFLAQKAFVNDFDDATVLKWLQVFYKRFFTQQFKRSCLPDGVKVGSVALSPRGDWRMPSDASYNLWLKDIENIKSRISR